MFSESLRVVITHIEAFIQTGSKSGMQTLPGLPDDNFGAFIDSAWRNSTNPL